MTKAHVFLIDGKDELVQMPEAPYPLESDLQEILARHPDLLPGDQLDPDNPRRWLLVGREIGVPAAEDEADWWSLDHLFLDQSGIPTFVECKRACDTRSRREVVAQMLDYAANGTAYWSVEKLRQKAAETATSNDMSLDRVIENLLGPDAEFDPESFWDQVDENLRTGCVRLLFVLDKAPRELRRLVEFLNEKTKDVELAIVEVKRFAGSGTQVMVPRVIGLTEASTSKITGERKRPMTESELLAKADSTAGQFFSDALSLASDNGWDIYWGTTGCSLRAPVGPGGGLASLLYLFPERGFHVYFGHLELDKEKNQKIRSEVRNIGSFREAGDYTLKQEVTPETVDGIQETVEHMMARVRDWIEAGKVT